jgi:hypothetical protein
LVCEIENNPDPTIFPVKCTGASPSVLLNGPWEEEINNKRSELASLEGVEGVEEEDQEQKDSLEQKKASLREEIDLLTSQLEQEKPIVFEKLLLGRQDQHRVTIVNTSDVPVSWKLEHESDIIFMSDRDPEKEEKDEKEEKEEEEIQEQQEEKHVLDIYPQAGTIPVGGKATVYVDFSSFEETTYEASFSVLYADIEDGLAVEERTRKEMLIVKAEGYSIQAVTLIGEQEEEEEEEREVNEEKEGMLGGVVDFGLLRVGQVQTKSWKMRNNGKYPVQFECIARRASTRRMVQIVPSTGSIDPEGEIEISMTFICQEEVHWKNNKDVLCSLIEPTTGEKVDSFVVFMNVNAKFSRFRLQPSKGINFGAIRFDQDKEEKSLFIKNEGSFEFGFLIVSASTRSDPSNPITNEEIDAIVSNTPSARRSQMNAFIERHLLNNGKSHLAIEEEEEEEKEEASVPAKHPLLDRLDSMEPSVLPEGSRTFGSFELSQFAGFVQPGQSQAIDIRFSPSGHRTFQEDLTILICGWDEHDANVVDFASCFSVAGESCYPGMDASSFSLIFEEQSIIDHLSDVSKGGKLQNMRLGQSCYATRDNLLAFSPYVCGSSTKGKVERVKIINPTKVYSTVRFALEPSEHGVKEDDVSFFSFSPEVLDIPPHEYQFVTIHFQPVEMRAYRAHFSMQVDDATAELSGGSSSFSFDIGGSGLYPSLSIENIAERNERGALVLDFGRIPMGKTVNKSFNLRNIGKIPATGILSWKSLYSENEKEETEIPLMQSSDYFVCHEVNSSIALNAQHNKTVDVTFRPLLRAFNDILDRKHSQAEEGAKEEEVTEVAFESTMKLTVMHNQFEMTEIVLKGMCFNLDADIQGLDDDTKNELSFDPILLSNEQQEEEEEEERKQEENVATKFFSVLNKKKKKRKRGNRRRM